MRSKKSKNLFFIAGIIIILGIIFVSTKDISPKIEHVEQPLENSFLK